MNQNQQFFIQVLSDHLHGEKTELSNEVDWNEILKLSKSHQVEGIVYSQCKSCMPSDVCQIFDRLKNATLYKYVNRKQALNEVIGKLKEEEIPHIIVKGFSIAKYYPIPALRTMVDCDIVVNRKDMPAAMELMRSIGYKGIENKKAESWECVKDNITFELHDRLVSGVDFLNPDQESFFNNYDLHVINGELDGNFHFLFIIIHLRKHFINSGVGIRQFMDIAVLIKNHQELDWTWIEDRLAEFELLRFAQSCFYLLDKWFGIEPPISCDSVNMEQVFYENVTERILKNGIFGKDDAKNVGNYERNVLINSKGWMVFRRAKFLIRNVFPSYSYMRTYPGCNYVDGRPYLLIVAWLHRFYYYSNRNNRSTVRHVIKEAFSDREILKAQEDFYKKMGL